MVLFNGMSQTSPWAALYFVTLMTFGNYVLFNLLVAILVEGFQESKEEEKRQLVSTASIKWKKFLIMRRFLKNCYQEEEALKKAKEEEEERKTQ